MPTASPSMWLRILSFCTTLCRAARLVLAQGVETCSQVPNNRSTTQDLAYGLQVALGFPQRVLTSASAPTAFGAALQGYYSPGDPQAYGAVPALVVQPQSTAPVLAYGAACMVAHKVTSSSGGRICADRAHVLVLWWVDCDMIISLSHKIASRRGWQTKHSVQTHSSSRLVAQPRQGLGSWRICSA